MTTCDNISILFQLWNIFRVCSLSLTNTLHTTSCAAFVQLSANRRQHFPQISSRTTDFLDILIKFQFSCHVLMKLCSWSWGKTQQLSPIWAEEIASGFTPSTRIVLFWVNADDMVNKGLIYTIVMNVGVKLIIFCTFSVDFSDVEMATKPQIKISQIDLIS